FIDLDKLKGNLKIVSINSTWCDVCTQVFPILNELNAKYQADTNVSIIGISVWEDDDPISAISDMKKEYDINFPYYIDNTDILPRKLNVFGFPTILIVDKDNYVRYTIRGFNNGEELIKLIDDFVEILK
ncbi:TlpA family protein disulfide reductase, partial [bacterium]